MRKEYAITVADDDGQFSSQIVLLDDDGLRALQRGILIAQGVDWTKTKWTRGEALDEYAEHLSGEGRQQLFEDAVDTISDLELFEFMEYMTEEEAEQDRLEAAEFDWSKTKWTHQEAIDAYIDCLNNWKKHELVQHAVEEISEKELHEFMVNCNDDPYVSRDDRKIILGEYVSGDDVELDPETAAQYRADRRKDDAPEST